MSHTSAASELTSVDPAYARLPTKGSDEPTLGGALITWVEPMPDHVVSYNRWYEDDHMITGAMSMPWMFSCRRWVAPKWIQHLRAPLGSRLAEPLEAGKYIGLYWVNTGRLDDHAQWGIATNYRLHEEGRGSCRGKGFDPLEERRHIFTAFCDYQGPAYRDDAVPRDVHTLVQPYQGLVVEIVEARDSTREALNEAMADSYMPEKVGGPVAVSLRFNPRPLPETHLTHVHRLEDTEQMVVLLHFLDSDPRECWAERFADSAAQLTTVGGSLLLQAAFVPTRHGTNTYTEELF